MEEFRLNIADTADWSVTRRMMMEICDPMIRAVLGNPHTVRSDLRMEGAGI
jgi:hypothetical protein